MKQKVYEMSFRITAATGQTFSADGVLEAAKELVSNFKHVSRISIEDKTDEQ